MKIQNRFQFSNLPLPDKNEALIKFLDYVKPLILDEEYQLTQLEVYHYLNIFIRAMLHNILLNRAQEENNSLLVDWWIKYVYLSSQVLVIFESNAPMIFSHKNMHKYDVASVVAVMVFKVAELYLELKNNNLINNRSLNLKRAFFLNQLIYLFASIHELNLNFDSYYTNKGMSDFVIIYQHNIACKVKVIKDGSLLISINEIYMNLKHFFNQKSQQNFSFHFVSADINRSEAKIISDELLINDRNQKSYQFLKDAIVVISHDAIKNEVVSNIFKSFAFASDYNRLHGKIFLISIGDNKNVVMSTDHTKVNGGIEIYLMNRIAQLFDEKSLLWEMKKIPDYGIIEFKLESNIQYLLKLKFKQCINYINRADVIYIESNKLYKQLCKQLKIVLIDRLIQFLYQIAQYETNQQFYNTYIAVDPIIFFKSRTECIMPISNESKQFAIDFINHKLKDKKIIFEKLQEIFNIYYQHFKDCQNAHGINMYMSGLESDYNDNCESMNITRLILFISFGWKTITQNILFTSSIISPNIEWVYFDPVHESGLSIFYAIENYARFSISYSKKNCEYANSFSNNFEWAIDTYSSVRIIEV